MTKSKGNEYFILKDDRYFYHYRHKEQAFQKIMIPPIAFDKVLSITIDVNNILWVFTSDSNIRSYEIKKSEKGVTFVPKKLFQHPEKLLAAFAENDLVCFIDATYALHEYDLTNQKLYYIYGRPNTKFSLLKFIPVFSV